MVKTSATYYLQANFAQSDVIVFMASRLFFQHQVVHLFQEGRPLFATFDVNEPFLLVWIDYFEELRVFHLHFF